MTYTFNQYLLLFFLCTSLVLGCSTSRSAQSDSSAQKKASEKESDLKPYDEIITNEAVTDEGLFDVHSIEEKLYYEIPDSLLSREILMVSRIAETPTGYFGFFSGGSKVGEQVITFERKRNKILLRKKSYSSVAADSLPIAKSVQANNYEPILAAFDIQALSPDSAGVVIDMTNFFTEDVPAISGVIGFLREQYKVQRLDEGRSYIDSAKSFPKNIETRHVLTYVASEPPSDQQTNTLSLLMNQSMVLLPKEPMRPRLADHRVGWFTVEQINFGSDAQKAESREYIRRWKLEPKDMEAYKKGELVEPKKPIVYYLDPATPKKYRPYIMRGIEDWNVAFEEAGFKNAVIAKEPPSKEENPDFSPEDIRYSMIRYVANTTRNAVGPSVSDPRSGEIIESDIIWYHNHLRSYRNRLMIETGAANPEARSLKLDDDLIGETMRRVIAHEVGHAIGLPHNMQASSAYPVDSLRSGSFTHRMGIAPTIMDYARQNYIAQPGDENIRFIRKIGPYDKYAVNWGYRIIPEAATPEDEKTILDDWILEKAGDPIYRFENSRGYDPSIQTEDLSDDPVQASTYGMKNLQRVVPNLIEWTSTEGESYDDLEEIYGELVFQWNRYVNHVITNIGGVYTNRKATDQDGPVYNIVSESYQQKAMKFLNDHALSSPDWLMNQEILSRIDYSGAVEQAQQLQSRFLERILDNDRMLRLVEAETFKGDDAYTLQEMLADLRKGVWSEIYSGSTINTYRRNLQRSYLEIIKQKLDEESEEYEDVAGSDIQPQLKQNLKALKSDLEKARIADASSKRHLNDAVDRIDAILNIEK
jgi:hypothetical protein